MGQRVDLSGQTEVTGTSPGLRGYVARPASPGPWPGVATFTSCGVWTTSRDGRRTGWPRPAT